MMTRDEFLIACFSMGYCSPLQAKEYAGDRDEFTDEDFIKVYRKYSNSPHSKCSVTRVRANREMQGRLATNDEET